jgi:titin
VTLSWTAPSFNGGRVITNYSVYRGIASGEEILQVALGNVLTYTDTSLINGQTYFYKVSAVNLAGVGPQSDEVTAIPYTAPNVPTGLTAIADNGRVTLNWTAPAFNGGNAIDYYAIYKDGVALLDHPIGLAMVIGDLTNGLTYSFTIAAHNLAGNGTQSNATFSRPYTVPDVSTGLTAIAGDAQITLNWTSPPFDGGRAIDYYVIYQDGIALPDLRTDLTTTIPRVINGQNYSFTVAAHNLAGLGPQSIVASGMPFTTPNVPIGLHAIAGNTQVTLNWTAPGFNGGRAIDYYIVYQEGLDAAHSTTTMAIITNLNNGQGYNFTVMAHNVAGNSTQSNSVSTTPMTVPGAPTGVTATPGPNKVTITWQAPLTTGGSPIIWYTVYRDSIPFIDVNASTMEFVDPTGTVGTTYTYYVVATNAAGNGPGSLAISVASQADNTLLYIGIGAIAIIALAGVAFLVLRKRK